MGEEDLKSLLEKAKTITMTDEEKEAQRRDFAYGNTRLSNLAITRALVDHVADRMLRSQIDEPKPRLVQRLVARSAPCLEADSIFRDYQADYMGAAEFEHGILEVAHAQACKVCRSEAWFVRTIVAGPDIAVYYVGSERCFKPAAEFLQTQLIEDRTDRYMADRPLKESTWLREAYLCQGAESRFTQYTGWWRLDLDHQFFFFKTEEDAKRCLVALQTFGIQQQGKNSR